MGLREDGGMSKVSVAAAVCQFAPTNDRAHNLTYIGEQVALASERGADLVVFPEYSSFFVDKLGPQMRAHAEPLDGPFVSALQALAAENAVTIVAGLVEATGDEHVQNTVVAVDHAGLRARYRKLHLYDAFGQQESDWVRAGEIEEPEVFEIGGLRLGLMTCYDLRFPEVARTLADAAVDVIVVPAEWVRGPLKEHHWLTLLQARAIENTAFVVAADHPAPIGVGQSAVIDPQGVRIAGVGAAEGMAIAHLDPALVQKTRSANPVLQQRRYRVVPNESMN